MPSAPHAAAEPPLTPSSTRATSQPCGAGSNDLKQDKAASGGNGDGFGAAGGTELAAQRCDVELGGILTDPQPTSDAFVWKSLCHELQHLQLARSERLRQRRRRRE